MRTFSFKKTTKKIFDPIHIFSPLWEKIVIGIALALAMWQLFWYAVLLNPLPAKIWLGYKISLPYVPGPYWEWQAWVFWTMIWLTGMGITWFIARSNKNDTTQLASRWAWWAFYGMFLVNCFSQF